MDIWLFNINPKNDAFGYSWPLDKPKSLLSGRHAWHLRNYIRRLRVGHLICIYMKNIEGLDEGVHIVGTVTDVDTAAHEFEWTPDKSRSARTLAAPIPKEKVVRHFSRAFGSPIRPLKSDRAGWLRLLQIGEIVSQAPTIKARKKPNTKNAGAARDPLAQKKNGEFGERYVVGLLRQRYPKGDGYDVVHHAKNKPGADHDIEVRKGKIIVCYVEVKTRQGDSRDRVIISEREMQCRRNHPAKHRIFIVYLHPPLKKNASDADRKKAVYEVVEIGETNAYELGPRQHWLIPYSQ